MTTWQKLRISGAVTQGQTVVYVDQTDTTYATSNGRTGDFHALTAAKWGFAADCRGGAARSRYRLNLRGTPFRLEAAEPALPIAGAQATGGAACAGDGKTCAGECGGACGQCGFGRDHDIQVVRLLVEDQAVFDLAFPVDCGPPSYATYYFPPECDTTSRGTCEPQCAAPYGGAPHARCTSAGVWEYGAPCDQIATCFVMGWNSFGQLGTRGTRDEAAPHALYAPNGEKVVGVAVGGWHSALLTASAAYVMGSNSHGQLGLGPAPDDAAPAGPQPLPAPNGAVVTTVALGNSHTVFVAGGAAYAAGDNRFGQAGAPGGAPRVSAPRLLEAPTGAAVGAVFAGSFHTAFLTEPGALYRQRTDPLLVPPAAGLCGNYTALPGGGAQTGGATIDRVCEEIFAGLAALPGPYGAATPFFPGPQGDCPAGHWEIAANGRTRHNWGCCAGCPGGSRMCYSDCSCVCSSATNCSALVVKEDGTGAAKVANCLPAHGCSGGAPCYPLGAQGWQCFRNTLAVRLTPGGDAECMSRDGVACYSPCAAAFFDPAPHSVACGAPRAQWGGATGYEDVHPRHWCYEARRDLLGPQAYVLGHNAEGMLGLGDTVSRSRPVLLPSPNAARAITAVALGRYHSAVLAGGLCYVFGSNEHGQLGLGRAALGASFPTPQLLPAPPDVGPGAAITHIEAGHAHTALVAGGQLYVMGSNSRGQLGLGLVSRATQPTRVPAPNGAVVTAVAAGAYATVFIAGRECYVTGANSNGQLGLGSFQDVRALRALQAPNGLAVDQVAAGWFHSAFTADLTVTPTATATPPGTSTPSATATPSGTPTATPWRTSTPSASPTRSSSLSSTGTSSGSGTVTSSPSSTATPSVSATVSRTSSTTATLSHSSTASTTPSSTATCSHTLSGTPSASLSASQTTTPSSTPSATPTRTPTRTPSMTATPRHTSTPSTTPSRTSTPTITTTLSRSSTPSTTPSRTVTPTAPVTRSNTLSSTRSISVSLSLTTAASRTPTPSPSGTRTTTPSSTLTRSPTTTPSSTTTPHHTLTPSSTPSGTPTPTVFVTCSTTLSSTITAGSSATPTSTPSTTPSTTPSSALTRTPTTTPSITTTPSHTFTPSITLPSTPTITASVTRSTTISGTTTARPSGTPSSSSSITSSLTPSVTVTCTPTITPSMTTPPSGSVTASTTPSSTATSTVSGTSSATPSGTHTPRLSATPSSTATPSRSTPPTPTLSCTLTCSLTTTISEIPTPSPSFTPSSTPSSTLTPTASVTSSATLSRSWTATLSSTLTTTQSITTTPSPPVTATTTPSGTLSGTATLSGMWTPTPTSSYTLTPSCTRTAGFTLTSTTTASHTPTSSRLFTASPTASCTPTVSSLFTPSTTPSSTLTGSRLYTGTGTASHTITASSLFTPSTTPSSTLTGSRLYTGTGTASHTITASSLFTPSTTPSSTLTGSRLYTGTGTASHTITASSLFTPSTTPSSTLTGSRLYTGTGTASHTITASSLFTPSTTPSSTLTGSRLYTGTGTASHTITASSLFTPSTTPSSTLTGSRLYTGTGTASHTITASSLFTPSTTPSSTLTGSRLYTGTGTASHTITASSLFTPSTTPSYTPTPSALFTPTPTVSDTPSALHTATVTRSQTATPTCASTSTQVPSPTATSSRSRTPTPTGTAIPTATPSPTGTALFDLCSTQAAVGAGTGTGRLQVQDVRKCMHSASMGTGSSLGVSRRVMIRILRLDGNLTVHLASSCTLQGDACTARFAPPDEGREALLPVGDASVEVLMQYAPLPGGAARRGARARDAAVGAGFAVELLVVHAASGLLVLLLALGVVLAVLCCAAGCRRHARRMAAAPLTRDRWDVYADRVWPRHPRWRNPWVQVGLACGPLLAAAGLVWYIVLDHVTHAADPSFPLAVVGLGLVGLGAAVFAAAALAALREDAAGACPECGRAASRWRFAGTHVPVFDGDGGDAPMVALVKGHTECLRCVECRAPVVVDRWAPAPPHRPYHDWCWEALCARLCAAPGALARWDAAQSPTAVELAHVLAAAIRGGHSDAVAALLALHPDLDALPLPEWPRARHCAARAGRLPELRLLVDRCVELDALDGGAPPARHSVHITGLGFGLDDLYVDQAPLRYNAREVFVGLRFGNYLYFFLPAAADPVRYPAGWCLADYLGNGNTAFRLPLDPAEDPAEDAAEAVPGGTSSWSASLGHKYHAAKRKLHLHSRNPLEPAAHPATDAPATHSTTGSLVHAPTLPLSHFGSIVSSTPSDATVASTHVSTHFASSTILTSGAAADVPLLTLDEVGLQWVPQVPSLLDAAVASGEPATIRCVFQAYKARYPHCLRWQYHAGHGLWDTYPEFIQQQIAHALARSLPAVALGQGQSLDLANLEHRAGDETRRMQCHMPTLLQYLAPDGGARVTAAPGDVPDWERAFVTLVSGSVAAAARDPATLLLLATEGMVDPTLWQPACKHKYQQLAVPEHCSPQWLSDALMAFLRPAFGFADDVALALPAEARGRRSRRGTAPLGRQVRGQGESRFSDGLLDPGGSAPRSAFYDAGYRCKQGAIAFSLALPDNDLGLLFTNDPIVEMCAEAVIKVHELRRQRVTLSAVHVVPLYVYTYELSGDGDQIYSAMNRAMRVHDEAGIAFWRPLIWQVTQGWGLVPDWHADAQAPAQTK